MNSLQTIFVDSAIFVALVKKDDAHHNKIKQIFHKLEKKLLFFVLLTMFFQKA